MKFLINCPLCDWTLTDPNSVRIYVNDNELDTLFNLESDGSFDFTGLMTEGDTINIVCADCGKSLANDDAS